MKNKIIAICILFLGLFSCKKETTEKKHLFDGKKESQLFTGKNFEYKFIFPDTVYINKDYGGEIIYKSALDTITTSFDDNKKSRYTKYYFRKSDNIDYDGKELKKNITDTCGAINNHTIPFYVKFKKLGIQYIDGIVHDHVFIDTIKGKAKSTDKVRYIEMEIRATHKIIVINKQK
jgi:hypothetical protein